ncbi:MAG: hypothetical protein JWP49_2013 [Phenylobacterium sp.]|nr:hypothetical protein [Phenylobacterium sp.]
MARRIEIDGQRLRRDRDDLRLSRSALVAQVTAAGERLTEKQIGQAENDGLISQHHLSLIAKVLKLPADRYTARPPVQQIDYDGHMAGKWRVLYLQQDDMTPPFVCEEVLTIMQDGQYLEGDYDPIRTHHPDPDEPVGERRYWMRGKVERHFVSGEYGPHDGAPTGNGYYLLKATQQGVWEGFCTFYTLDERIAMSLNIWIREDLRSFKSIYRQQFQKMEALKNRAWQIAPFVPGTYIGQP